MRTSQLNTQAKKFLAAVRQGDIPNAEQELNKAYKQVDQTAAKGSIHKNAAARKKARLARQLAKLKSAKAEG